jgi:hypothetical protein
MRVGWYREMTVKSGRKRACGAVDWQIDPAELHRVFPPAGNAVERREYKNPPINELVLGLYFDRHILPFRSEHVGLFWGSTIAMCRLRQNAPPPRRKNDCSGLVTTR